MLLLVFWFFLTRLAQSVVIQPSTLEKVCNLLAPGSYHSVSDIGFERLAEVPIRLIGCYGNCEVIFKWLLQNNVMEESRLVLLKDI